MEVNEVLERVIFNLESDFEETIDVYKYCCLMTIRILFRYGFSDKLYREPLLLAKDFIGIKKKEADIFKCVRDNIDFFDNDEIYSLLVNIDLLHKATFDIFDRDLDDMEKALMGGIPYRIKRSNFSQIVKKLAAYENEMYELKSSNPVKK